MRHGVSKEAASEWSLNGEHFCALLHMLQKREDAGSLLHLWDLSIWAFIHTDVLILKTSDWRFSVLGRKKLFMFVAINRCKIYLRVKNLFIEMWVCFDWYLYPIYLYGDRWQPHKWIASKASWYKRHQHFFPPQHLLYACICWPYLCMRMWWMYAHVHVCIYVMFWTYFHKIHRQTLVLCCVPVTKCMTASACLSVCEALYKCWCFWCCSGLVLRWMFEVRHGTTCMTERHVIPDKLSHGAAHLSHSSGR